MKVLLFLLRKQEHMHLWWQKIPEDHSQPKDSEGRLQAQDFLDAVFPNDSLLFTPRRDQMTRILSGFDAQHKATDSTTAIPPVSLS